MKNCSITGCEGEIKARGLCDKHYLRAKRAGELELHSGPGAGRRSPEWSRTCAGVHVCGKDECARGLCNTCYQVRRKDGELSLLPIVNAGKNCSVEGCKNGAQGLGYCGTHYDRFKKYGDALGVAEKRTGGPCATEGCSGVVVANGVCAACYARIKKYGHPGYAARHMRRFEKVIDSNGYVRVPVPGPDGKVRRVPEHRQVMEQFLGRPIRKNENVHHKNGDRTDNRIQNLELWVTTQPAGQRPQDLMRWAREILKTYAPDEARLKKLAYRNQRQ